MVDRAEFLLRCNLGQSSRSRYGKGARIGEVREGKEPGKDTLVFGIGHFSMLWMLNQFQRVVITAGGYFGQSRAGHKVGEHQ